VHSSGDRPPFRCHFCLDSYNNENTAHRHVVERHGITNTPWHISQPGLSSMLDPYGRIPLLNGGFQCGDCGLCCSTQTQILAHRVFSHTMITDIGCNYCIETFPCRTKQRVHVLMLHGGYRYKCPECGASYEKPDDFSRHVQSEHFSESKLTDKKKEGLSCQLCHHRVRGPLMLSKHMQSIHGLKQEVNCGKCGELFESYSDLSAHNRLLHNNKSAPCQFCGKLFESRPSLEVHISVVHEGKPQPKEFLCETCSRTFSSRQLLQTHSRCHSSDKKITCKICGKAFNHTKAAHSSNDISLISYDCKFCGKSFKDKSNLKNHAISMWELRKRIYSKGFDEVSLELLSKVKGYYTDVLN
ncbi:Zinc finger protein 184like, partial [Caligus rogercresseyi]